MLQLQIFIFQGLNMGIIGPTLPDLALQTHTTIPEATNIIIWRSFAYILGSMVAAFLLDHLHMDEYLMMAVSMIFQAVTLAWSVVVTDILIMCILQAIANMFTTIILSGKLWLT